MERIEINVQTGEQIIVQLSAEEIAEAELQNKKWLEEQSKIQSNPTIEELQAQLALLTEKIQKLTQSSN